MKNKDKDREKKRSLYGEKWEVIFTDEYPRLLNFARDHTRGDEFAAKDLVQETLCRIVYYSPDPEKIKSSWQYLRRTLKNLWIDQWKLSNSYKMESLDDPDNESAKNDLPSIKPMVLFDLENEDLRKELQIATRDLKLVEKRIFRLYLDGYNTEEIGAYIGRDKYYVNFVLNAVKVKIKYRVKKIKGN